MGLGSSPFFAPHGGPTKESERLRSSSTVQDRNIPSFYPGGTPTRSAECSYFLENLDMPLHQSTSVLLFEMGTGLALLPNP